MTICKQQALLQYIDSLTPAQVRKVFAVLNKQDAVEHMDHLLPNIGLTVGEFCTLYMLSKPTIKYSLVNKQTTDDVALSTQK